VIEGQARRRDGVDGRDERAHHGAPGDVRPRVRRSGAPINKFRALDM
jgi:hypothetical protein